MIDELISRKAALEATCNNCCDDNDCARGCADYMEIANIPAVEAKPVVHGRWERVAAYNDGVLNTVACSVCKTYQPIGAWDYYPYCMHCGAEMDGE
jgi:hypothetical protein